MSIANELSSDIAAAVLARKNEGASDDSGDIKDVLVQVHSTLRDLTLEMRRRGRPLKSSSEPPAVKGATSTR
jgi:hypothetical protein